VVLEAVGVVIAVMIPAMVSWSLKGSVRQGRGTSGWSYMSPSLPLAWPWNCTGEETWEWRQNTDSLARHWKWVKWLKHVNQTHNTGRFIMFSVVTNIYNKKTKWHALTLRRLTTYIHMSYPTTNLQTFSSKCRLFHNATFLGSCIIHIVHTGCANIKKKFRRQRVNGIVHSHSKTEKVFLATRDVRCVHHGWHGTHRYDIQVLATNSSTWVHRYSSLLQWSVPLDQRGHVAMVRQILCTKCTSHNNHRLTPVIFQHTKDLSPGAAIFSLHTRASSSGRNVNYDEKQLSGEKHFELFP
jgi:uncharacterized membrane protein SirB2